MKITAVLRIALAISISQTAFGTVASGGTASRELKVHLAQANNQSPYAFVRAKFLPGELIDPWAVRFFDENGAEIPYFVWDSVTWKVAREGRADWGHRFALINHAAGDAPETLNARNEKLQWAKKNLPDLGARLEAQYNEEKQNGDSICAAMFVLHHSVPAMGKERISLRIYPKRQVEPGYRQFSGAKVGDRITVQQGELRFQGLPDRLSVTWNDKELFHSAGFDAGGASSTFSHADPARPFSVETIEGIVTKVVVTGQTGWRQDGAMDWQCTYWLFPEGNFVALEGFSLTHPAQYMGGPQQLSRFATPDGAGAFAELHAPDWDKPWWLHRAGDHGFVAAYLFSATPLTIGYCNNPYTVNVEGPKKEPRVDVNSGQLALQWFHEANDPAILRLSYPQAVGFKNGHVAAADNQPVKPVWQPKIDWLYRQYIAGVGEEAGAAEASLRSTLGAAAGWIDRPVSEEETAALLVAMMRNIGVTGQSAEIGLLKIIPAVFDNNQSAINETLKDRLLDVVSRTDQYIEAMRKNVADGGQPAAGSKLLPNGIRVEGWTGNPCYHASLMPCYVRVLEFLEQPFAKEQYHEAILRYADFGLELLGGNPFDIEKLRKNLESQWPSRVVPTIPLMLHANSLRADEKYVQSARMLFEDIFHLVERNPHGYFPAWSFTPGAAGYDTVYDPVSYDRGITAIWYEEAQDRIGREATTHFVAAQARWMVFSGQLLDTLEMDNVTAIRASNHGAHTNLRNQIGLYLYDDFGFYRGVIGDLIAWSAASDQVPDKVNRSGTGPYRGLILSNAGSTMVRWGLDIRPGNKCLESKVQPLAPGNGFKLQIWNRLPLAKPMVNVTGKEAGLAGDDVALEVQLLAPAYRQPAEFEVTRAAGKLLLKTSQPAKLGIHWQLLCPDWPADTKPVLHLLPATGQSPSTIANGVKDNGDNTWQVVPGLYELRRSDLKSSR